MTIELKEFTHEGKVFLAVGSVTFDRTLDYPFIAERADGVTDYFNDREDAIEFIAKGLKKPTNWTLE